MLLLIFSIVQYNCEPPPPFSRKYTGDCHLPPDMCNLQSPFPPIRDGPYPPLYESMICLYQYVEASSKIQIATCSV